MFANLSNTSALCYYGKINRNHEIQGAPTLTITNITVMNNIGFGYLKMFYIKLGGLKTTKRTSNGTRTIKVEYTGFSKFYNCSFFRNTNIQVMLYVEPFSQSNLVHILIVNTTFHNNTEVHFLKVGGHIVLPNIMTSVFLTNLTVLNNDQRYYGNDLILITNAYAFLSKTCFAHNTCKYNSVIKLHSSMTYFLLSNRFIKNKARYLIKAQEGSMFFIHRFATVSVVDNIAYKVILQENTSDNFGAAICPLQVHDIHRRGQPINLDSIYCIFILLNNTEMVWRPLPGQFLPFINTNCIWYPGSNLKKFNASVVYHKIIQYNNNAFMNKTTERSLPLSVCPYSHNNSYNCYKANLGSVFPGQTLHIQLIIPHQWSTSSSTIIAANTKDDNCSIVDSYQLSQSHSISHGCNNYSYTVWANSRHTTECKLFIGLSEMPEMFYVQIKPCPVGFTLQSDKNLVIVIHYY